MTTKITDSEREVLNSLFNDHVLDDEQKRNLGTDLSVEYHDTGLIKLSNNQLDAAAKDFTVSIVVAKECLKQGKYFYSAVAGSSCYYMAITLAKQSQYNTALALAKEAYHIYKSLQTCCDFKKEISEVRQLIKSLDNMKG